MTDLELEIQKLRRRVSALEANNRALRHENTMLLMEKKLDMGDKVRLRREVEFWQAKSEEWRG